MKYHQIPFPPLQTRTLIKIEERWPHTNPEKQKCLKNCLTKKETGLLVYPERSYTFKRGDMPLTDNYLSHWAIENILYGDLMLEHTILNDDDLDGIADSHCNGYIEIDLLVRAPIHRLKLELLEHWNSSQEIESQKQISLLPEIPWSGDEAMSRLMKVLQWQFCKLSIDMNGNVTCKHIPSQMEIIVDQNKTINNLKGVAQQLEYPVIAFVDISFYGSAYHISRLMNVIHIQGFLNSRGMSAEDFEKFCRLNLPIPTKVSIEEDWLG